MTKARLFAAVLGLSAACAEPAAADNKPVILVNRSSSNVEVQVVFQVRVETEVAPSVWRSFWVGRGHYHLTPGETKKVYPDVHTNGNYGRYRTPYSSMSWRFAYVRSVNGDGVALSADLPRHRFWVHEKRYLYSGDAYDDFSGNFEIDRVWPDGLMFEIDMEIGSQVLYRRASKKGESDQIMLDLGFTIKDGFHRVYCDQPGGIYFYIN